LKKWTKLEKWTKIENLKKNLKNLTKCERRRKI